MIDLAEARPARIFTTWGTVLYVDSASGQLRHGPIETSPENAVFLADRTAAGPNRQGRFMFDSGERLEPIACGALSCRTVSATAGEHLPVAPTVLEVVPLERGLIAFHAGKRFVCAQPDGRLDLTNTRCSTWECFLASEDWCATRVAGEGPPRELAGPALDKRQIAGFIVDARLRAKANAASKATRVLIYGYPAWSHGRLFYDLSKNLYKEGYIVDIINWQVNHASYMAELISYYDLFISPLDGLRTLLEVYRVPAEKVIGLSQHEMDIRILIGQMGVEVFDRLAGYGVTSYQLFDASVIFGVPRHPLVVQHGVAFDEFYAEVPERLTIVGYAGSFSHKTLDGLEIKRGEIAEAAAREAGLAFRVAGSTANQISFHDMPDFYKSVDAVLISSVTEGAQLPAKEGAAAGRLIISTPVGDFPLRASQGVGIVAPIESHKYKKFVTQTLSHYKENPAAFVEMCRKTQDAARQLDWPNMIGDWVELIEGAKGWVLERARWHQEAGRFDDAARLFAQRADSVRDEEESWYARWQQARCLRDLKDEERFVSTALKAFRERPHRAEPLQDLANYYLDTRRGVPAAFFAEAALAIPNPEQDRLFLDPALYDFGVRHTFSVAASWSDDADLKERGRRVCDWLALSRDMPWHIRSPARYNSGWYAVSAESLLPSLKFHPLSIPAPAGFHAANIGICGRGDGFAATVRAVNYTLTPDGYHHRDAADPSYRSQVLLLQLDDEFRITASVEVDPPEDLPIASTEALGFEDPRPFIWRDGLWCVACVRQLNPEARAEMVLARIDETQSNRATLTDWRVLPSPAPPRWEKNWMPQVMGDELQFVYSVDPTRVLSDSGNVISEQPAAIAAETFLGGSQAVAFDDGWLMVVHEFEFVDYKRRYFHRFIWLDKDSVLRRLSRRFYLRQPGYEFVAGMAWHPDRQRIVISFSVDDRELFLWTVDANNVRAVLLEIVEHERASLEAVAAGRSLLEKLMACQNSSRDASEFGRAAETGTSKPADSGLRSEILRKIWRGNDPYVGFPKHSVPADLQGWNSYHPFLTDAIDKYRTRVVLEVGVWKGASTINMAKRMEACQIDGVVIAVDTWLGSSEHWIQDEWFKSLSCEFGYPRIYHQFLANVLDSGVMNIVIPLPMDSINAFHVMKDRQIQVDMIHIDGGHDYDSVSADLRLWWSLLPPGGIFVCDDYFDNGMWPEVKKAVDDFIFKIPHTEFEFRDGKCRAIKV